MSASVLIVEDERLIAQELHDTLTEWGYAPVAVAASSSEAVGAAESFRPDVVLMDIRIKGSVDGVTTATLLQQHWDVPIIYLTAHSDEGTLERAKSTRPYGYVLKPIKTPELRATLEIAIHRHRCEREARERDRWHQATLQALSEAVITVDSSLAVTFANSAAESLLGLNFDPARREPLPEILPFARDASILEALSGKRTWEDCRPVPSPSGNRRSLSERISPVYDGDHLLGAIWVLRDISAEVLLRQQLELSQRLASLGTLSAGVAHEINSPLTVISTGTSLLLTLLGEFQPGGQVEQKEMEELLLDIQDSAQRLRSIVADMQVFTRPRGHLTCDPIEVVRWALRILTPQLKGVEVDCRLTEGLRFPLDETRAGQIVINLLTNAVHALAERDRPRLEVRLGAEGEGSVLEIRDNGSGIPKENLPFIFDPFFTTKGPQRGTGLGLSIVHTLVQQHGGRIEVESSPGLGTTLRVYLPST